MPWNNHPLKRKGGETKTPTVPKKDTRIWSNKDDCLLSMMFVLSWDVYSYVIIDTITILEFSGRVESLRVGPLNYTFYKASESPVVGCPKSCRQEWQESTYNPNKLLEKFF